MSVFVSPEWLNKRMEQYPEETAVVDVRFSLGDPSSGEQAYLESHIPSAVYLDLDKHLSGTVQKHGGNHPLPDIDSFAEKLGERGIDENTTVIIYEQDNGMFSARLWWMLYYAGHDYAYILDGGLNRWKKEGYTVTDQVPVPTVKRFEPSVRANKIVHMEEVRDKVDSGTAVLLDSRAKDRYLGKTEPLHAKAGHIPGAKNYFWKNVLTEDGKWKDSEELKEHFSSLPKTDEIIVSCGSGVSACPNVLGLKMAGFKNVKLYPGSFSDWITYPENDVVTEEE